MNLKLAHIALMNQHQDIDEIKFWGKVEGILKNYYIFMGLKFEGQYEFPHKRFFWAYQFFDLDLRTLTSRRSQNCCSSTKSMPRMSMASSQGTLTRLLSTWRETLMMKRPNSPTMLKRRQKKMHPSLKLIKIKRS
jgi:hypothetical protein